jgi:sulfur carrier protein
MFPFNSVSTFVKLFVGGFYILPFYNPRYLFLRWNLLGYRRSFSLRVKKHPGTRKQMQLTVNNEQTVIPDGSTVRQLLAELGLANRPVAVERNRNVVSHRIFDETVLHNGDILEIVTLVGGG